MSNNWIFLRGLTRGNIHWGIFPTLFLEANPDAKVEFLEIPGNGLQSEELTPINPEVLIEILRNKSKLVQSDNKYHLCGISLGGMVALKWVELYPGNIESITVINSSLSEKSAFYKRLIVWNYLSLLKIFFEKDNLKQEKNILKLTSNKCKQNEKYIEPFSRFSFEHKIQKINCFRQLILAKNINLHSFPKVNLKVISSLNDRLVDSSCSLKIALSFGGKLIIHPTAGHDLPLDEPEWLVEQLFNPI